MMIPLCPPTWRTFVSQKVRISRNSMADRLWWRTLRSFLPWQIKILPRRAMEFVTISMCERTRLTAWKISLFRFASWRDTSSSLASGLFSLLLKKSLIPQIAAAKKVRHYSWIFGTTSHKQKCSFVIFLKWFRSISKLSKTGSACSSTLQFQKLESRFSIFSFFLIFTAQYILHCPTRPDLHS